MSRLDLGGLKDLWYRIDDVFARRAAAAGALVLNGTSIILSTISGAVLATIDLGSVFATRGQAGSTLSWSSPNLTLNDVDGSSQGSVNLGNGLATDAEAGHSLSISDRTITLKNVSGNTLNSVTVPNQDLSGYATLEWVKQNFFASAGISLSGDTFTITFYDFNGDYEDSVSFTIY